MKIRGVIGFILLILLLTGSSWAQSSSDTLTLEESIRIAMERNLALHSAKEGVIGSEFRRKAARADFLPKWTGQYGYTRLSDATTIGGRTERTTADGKTILAETTRDTFNLGSSLIQTLFSGGAISANYRFEKLGLELSKTNVETVKRDIVLQVRVGYYSIITTEKFVDVGKQAVKQFEAQLDVSKAFFEVGLIAKNDVLQAEVRLANARQALVKAENDVALAKSLFNNLLRREVNTPLEVIDILEYKPFPLKFEESLDEALRQRPELKIADLSVDQAKENVKIVRSGLFPLVSLSGNYSKNSDEAYLNGELKSDQWNITALATFTLWEWGKTYYRVGESKVKVTQAEDAKVQLTEAITLEVKDDYLNMLVAEKNIGVAQKSIEQAEENLRLNEERYKYQVATATDVLDAVVLLAQARVNYYSALSDFNIAKARLERAMGRM
ncbi:MAG TPA: TolC family protein [Thermodesulfobacteriota bacterium]|nr:TolC family protein [Thermodesulfobacteriota bacterium]